MTADFITHSFHFEDNNLLSILYGPENKNIHFIEKKLNVTIYTRGGDISLYGPSAIINILIDIMPLLYDFCKTHRVLSTDNIDQMIAQKMDLDKSSVSYIGQESERHDYYIQTPKKKIYPRNASQYKLAHLLDNHPIIFLTGPAGTGKTYMAVAKAVEMLTQNIIKKIFISRPVRESGESLGYLPGDLKDKVDPFMRPIYDTLEDMLLSHQIDHYFKTNQIEIAPLAYMRGRTLSHCFTIVDEAQNTTPQQMKMLLTRLGENAHLVINGDITQIDLPSHISSGLAQALKICQSITEIGFMHFSDEEIVRHPLIAKIIKAYQAYES